MRFLLRLTRRFRSGWQRSLPASFRRGKLHSQLVTICVYGTVFLNILYGVYLGLFSFRRKKFVFSKGVTIYSLCVATCFALFYIWNIYNEISTGQINLRNTIGIYCYMNVCVCLFNYVTQWVKTLEIIRFQNSVPLFKVLDSVDISAMIVWRAFVYSLLKIVFCPLIAYVTLILYQRRSHPETQWTSLATVKTMLPLIVSNQINNCFFGGLVIANLVIAALNRKLHGIVKESNMLQSPVQMNLHRPYYRMRRFCELADLLDELAEKYGVTASRSKKYLQFTDWSMVLSMLMNLLGITMGCYNQYLAIADHYINEEPFDLFQAIVLLVFLAVPFLELVMVARISNQTLMEVIAIICFNLRLNTKIFYLQTRRTGELLQRFELQHADARFKQVVNAFWLQVATIDYKLMPLGLLELNTSLVNKVFSSVTGSLLILIQSDLTLRFSLK
ncbi:putative gustatory receptor 97a [Drosophila teissieri]|uniref:putative gustatory receptor 97a n=1 Tax=Drosophila teissieri TaxID=7243 RepID=UPI001CBA13AD|nr:putative gustatory receptor 97a [Drosophila teissieri]